MPERAFSHHGCAVVVRSDRADLLEWLAEFTAPTLAVTPAPERPAAVVSVDVDPERFLDLATRGARTGERVACFTLDGPEQRLPVAHGDGGAWALDEEFRTALRSDPADGGRREVRVLAESERPDARLATLRAVRELVLGDALGADGVPLHAAAVQDASGVTLFAGRRRAGKSTLLLHALLQGGARYVANDRVLVGTRRGAATAAGIATIVSLREGSLACLPEASALAGEIESGAWHYASSVAEGRRNRLAGRVAVGSGYRKPPGISPAQLCSLLGVEASAGGPVARIVLPEVEPERRGFSLAPLPADEAAERLLRTALVAGGRSAGFLRGGAGPSRDSFTRPVLELTGRVPCFRCVLGEGAYEAPCVAEAIRSLPSGAA